MTTYAGNSWGWDNFTSATTNTSPVYWAVQPALSLPSVAAAPVELSDREWLDDQIAEVCNLAKGSA